MQIAYTGDEALLTVGVGPDHGIIDISINGWFWRRCNTYAETASEQVIHLPQVVKPDDATTGKLSIEVRSDKHFRSTGRVFRFKQLQVIDTTYNERTIDYTYDGLSRLLTANYDGGAVEYTYGYDLAGNLTNMNGATRTYNATNQLTNDGTNTLTYDANGNLTSNGTNTYTWDHANRMLTAPNNTSYTYDGLGNRISQSIGTTTPTVTQYLLDTQPGLTKVLAQTTGTNTNHFIHAPRGIHAMQNNAGDWSYMAQDGLGSVRSLIDATLGVDTTHNYDPYGNYIGTAPTNGYFGFTGEQTDSNGQVYLRARYYNPSIGIFSSLDPFEVGNRYAYVNGNPVNFTDPSGFQGDSPEPGSDAPAPVQFCRSQPGIWKGLCFSTLLKEAALMFIEEDSDYSSLFDLIGIENETLRQAADESWAFAGNLMLNYLGWYGSLFRETWRLGEARYVNMCRALNASSAVRNALQTNFVNCVLKSDRSACGSIDPGIQALDTGGASLLETALARKDNNGSSYSIDYGDWRFRVGFNPEETPDLKHAFATLTVGPYSDSVNVQAEGNDLIFTTQLEFWDNYDWIDHADPAAEGNHPFGMVASDLQSVAKLRLAKPYTLYGSIVYNVRVKNCNIDCANNTPLGAYTYESSIECVNPPGKSDFITVSLGTAGYSPRHTSENTDNVEYYP